MLLGFDPQNSMEMAKSIGSVGNAKKEKYMPVERRSYFTLKILLLLLLMS